MGPSNLRPGFCDSEARFDKLRKHALSLSVGCRHVNCGEYNGAGGGEECGELQWSFRAGAEIGAFRRSCSVSLSLLAV